MWLHLWYRDTRRSTRLKRSELRRARRLHDVPGSAAGVACARGRDRRARRERRRADRRPTRRARRSRSTTSRSPQTEIDSLWDQLAILHAAGIAHRRIDLDRIVRHDDGTAGFGDLSSSSVQADRRRPASRTAPSCSVCRRSPPARRPLSRRHAPRSAIPTWSTCFPYLQEAALPPIVRSGARQARRRPRRRPQAADRHARRREGRPGQAAPGHVGLGPQHGAAHASPPTRSSRCSAASTSTSSGTRSRDANWWWLLIALFVGQTPRVVGGVQHDGIDDASAAARADDRAPVRDVLHQPHRAELRRARGADHAVLPTQRHSDRRHRARRRLHRHAVADDHPDQPVRADLLRVRRRLRPIARSRRAERPGDDRPDRARRADRGRAGRHLRAERAPAGARHRSAR